MHVERFIGRDTIRLCRYVNSRARRWYRNADSSPHIQLRVVRYSSPSPENGKAGRFIHSDLKNRLFLLRLVARRSNVGNGVGNDVGNSESGNRGRLSFSFPFPTEEETSRCNWSHMCMLAVPRLDLESLESGYHGLVKENETLVEVTPQIRALGTKVCSFRIANKHHGEAPFEIVLKEKGMAELRAFRVLNCEKRRNYKFDIAAVGCNGIQSEKYVPCEFLRHTTL